MISIAVCDDDAKELDKIKEMTDKWCASHGLTAQILTFDRGEALLNTVIEGHIYDIFILDVLMPDIDGIALGKKLRLEKTVGSSVPIIYMSSSPEFAVDSYEVRAFYYLLKPVSYEQFEKIVADAISEANRLKNKMLPVRTRSGTYPVAYDEICYVILEERALKYICYDRTLTSMTIPGSFKSATSEMSGDPQFFLCGASMLVNLGQIKSIDKNELTFSNDVKLQVPRSTAKPLYKAWLDFWLE